MKVTTKVVLLVSVLSLFSLLFPSAASASIFPDSNCWRCDCLFVSNSFGTDYCCPTCFHSLDGETGTTGCGNTGCGGYDCLTWGNFCATIWVTP
jgi:hypothetical protein